VQNDLREKKWTLMFDNTETSTTMMLQDSSGRLFIKTLIDNLKVKDLLDTGAATTVFGKRFENKISAKMTLQKAHTYNGNSNNIYESEPMTLDLGNHEQKVTEYVSEEPKID
jgi:predicted aspartyl protease